MNPYALSAGPFLALFILAYAICTLLALRLRGVPFDEQPPPPQLDPLETGYLMGGVQRAADTAVTGLLQHGVASYDKAGKTLLLATPESGKPPLPEILEPFRRLLGSPVPIAEAVGRLLRDPAGMPQPASTGGIPTRDLSIRFSGALEPTRARLVREGLMRDETAALRIARHSALPLLILGGLGMLRVFQGLANHHPIIFILILSIAALIHGLVLRGRPAEYTARGRVARDTLPNLNRRIARAPQEQELMLAVAVGGVAVLATTEHADYAQARAPRDGGTGCGGGGGDGGSDGGGCGGGGCGGGGGD